MNIKRAFLAAAAVLMVPGFAMAQTTTTTFPTGLTVDPDPGAVLTFDVTRSCNSGTPLTETAPIADGSSVTFTALDVAAGSSCTISVDAASIPAGWEATTCSITTQADVFNYPCDLRVTQSLFDFEVDFEGDEDATGTVSFSIQCTNVGGTGNTLTNGPHTVDATADDTVEWLNVGAPNDETNSNGPVNQTVCSVIDASATDSSVGVAGCGGTTVPFGTTSASCILTASVFFQGIPTLSQYGLAIMALLMLGVGFVGFRRFV